MEKQDDEIFCSECGKPIKRNAVFCSNCGIQVKEIKTSPIQETVTNNYQGDEVVKKTARPKAKYKAVLLAVFLAYWSWLYTYGRSKVKFWIAFAIPILFVVSPAAGYIIYPAIWIWAIIDVSVKPTKFYTEYPNG